MFYVYILQSAVDKKWYVGFTEDIHGRLKKHNAGDVSSTRSRRPLRIIFFEGYLDKGDALRREQYFKTNNGKKCLKLMLRNFIQTSPPLHPIASQSTDLCTFRGLLS